VRIGIISDIHSNYDALEVVLKALEYEMVDTIICLGDLVGYGPEPDICIQRINETCSDIVLGNHDAAIIGKLDFTRFNSLAVEALNWTKENISDSSMKILSSLQERLENKELSITAVHGSPKQDKKWEYIIIIPDAEDAFTAFDTQICFIGHSHRPGAFVSGENGISKSNNPETIAIDQNKKYIINVGSVGQPRDNDPRAAYGILDTEAKTFSLKRLSYPVESVQKKMKETELPWQLSYRLSLGQ